MMQPAEHVADYGIDAPDVIRNLAIVGVAGLLLWIAVIARLVPMELVWRPSSGVAFRLPLGSLGLLPGLGCSAMAVWMVWSSKVGKLAERERLLNHVTWRGNERVLDVGCGRGLLLIAAAKRLTSG